MTPRADDSPAPRRPLSRRIGSFAGPLLLFAVVPCCLRYTLDRIPIAFAWYDPSGGLLGVLWGSLAAILLFVAWLHGWYRPKVARASVAVVLLVVLSYVFFPSSLAGRTEAVHAQALRMATNGSWIVKDILSAELDRRTNRDPPVWAPVGAYDSANAYLADLLETERIDSISFAGLAGAGVEPAHDCAELRLRGVAWNVLAGAAKADDSTPVLWTRNLRGLGPGDFAGADPERPRSWRDRLDPSDLRFGSEFIVLVRKSGSAEAIPVRNLTDAAFLGGSSNAPAALQVLEAR